MEVVAVIGLAVLVFMFIGAISSGKKFSDEDDSHTHYF